ncbi:isopenicillin N synthase family dioxygenase [Mycolicibacterium smegmatis]|uniref:isopenicillin N synthase family dioxygenase n=1 Tax=Mycolicibacterium smegmatis TaxID=1772 RepID=UPI001303CD64|nr:2-oxoglutarate and iron-dependent oxygenase domain-containing protein [Mycolicibacterium smegmatis]
MLSIPPVDLIEAAADPASRRRQFELLDAAFSEVGYVHVVGHRIPSSVFTELYAVTRRFFGLPAQEKSKVAQPTPEQVRGWSGAGSEGMAYSLGEETHADLKEKMDIGPVTGPTLGQPGAGPMAYPNLWPALPEFRTVWECYYQHMQRVGAELLALAAEGFGLSRQFFVPLFDAELSMLRALHFPPQPEPPLPHQFRAGIHTDYGAFTVVSAESTPGGLQVLEADGEWLEVNTTPATLVVLVGDLLAEWTGNHWPATLHRTANPPRSVAFENSRLAFAFYQHPNWDVEVAELSPFAGGAAHAPDDALVSGRHLAEKYVRQTTFGTSDPTV